MWGSFLEEWAEDEVNFSVGTVLIHDDEYDLQLGSHLVRFDEGSQARATRYVSLVAFLSRRSLPSTVLSDRRSRDLSTLTKS